MEQARSPTGAWSSRAISGPVRDTLKRYRVVKPLSAVFDVTLGPLALVGVGLLIIELLVRLEPPWNTAVYASQVALWVIFLAAFVIELTLAPRKWLYLRRNWFLIPALIVPALRILRFARALHFLRSARAVRGANVVRGFTSTNRALGAIRSFLGFSQFAVLAALTGIVWLAASGLVYYLEAGSESGVDSVGEALWWGAAVLTTINTDADPATTEGRIVAVALRVFGVAVIGYFTARLAAFFFGSGRETGEPQQSDEITVLRQEITALREELRAARDDARA